MRRTEGKLQELSHWRWTRQHAGARKRFAAAWHSTSAQLACPLKTTTLTGGTEAAATQGEGKSWGNAVHCETFDRDLTAEV